MSAQLHATVADAPGLRPGVAQDFSRRGYAQGYALAQNDKERVILPGASEHPEDLDFTEVTDADYWCLTECVLPIRSYFSFLQRKEKYQKKTPPFAQSLRGQRVSYTLLSFGAMGLHGTGLLPMRCCLWAVVQGWSSVWFWCYRIHIYDSKRCHQGLGFVSFISRVLLLLVEFR